MAEATMDAQMVERVVQALSRSPLFRGLAEDSLGKIATFGTAARYVPDEAVVRQGDPSDSFFIILKGEVSVLVDGAGKEPTEVARLRDMDSLGEMGLLLRQPRSATVLARTPVAAVKFDDTAFQRMFKSIPHFGVALSQALAKRLAEASRQMSLPDAADEGAGKPSSEAAELLPVEFVERHRVLPLSLERNVLTVGFITDPTPRLVNAIRQVHPSLELRPVRIEEKVLDEFLRSKAGRGAAGGGAPAREKPSKPSARPAPSGPLPDFDRLLERMVAEGASDLHLSGKHQPRWRIDGEMHTVEDLPVLGPEGVLDLMVNAIPEKHRKVLEETWDVDFAYAIEGLARFRVNLFRDHRGYGAVLRQIPDKILTFEQLGLPPAVKEMCDNPKGMVLVTGPTGSGKSTTLAAMIDNINKTRRAHIITLEDPIEFVHESRLCLVNQREVGEHTKSFQRALKAALREDPDIVLVGELRDIETMELAMETANTGHLVFGTLHTSTAVGTVERVVGMFPVERQELVRNILADVLKGVVAQTLCKRQGGGRVAALEILVGSFAVSNLIREGKTFQIPNIMAGGKKYGNVILNDALAELVKSRKVTQEEAMSRSLDKPNLAKMLGIGV